MKKILFPAFMILALVSCKKAEVDTETQTAVDNSVAEQAFVSVVPTVNSISVNEPGVNRLDSSSASCALITLDTTGFPAVPATMTIDYGAVGCLDTDGRFRQGKLICTFYDRWSADTATMKVLMSGFKIDNISYEGSLEMTRYGQSVPTLEYSVLDGKCVDPAWTILYECDRTIEQTEGGATADPSDDVFKYTGNSSGTNRKGVKFTSVIKEPLIKSAGCKWVESGVVDITPDGLATRTLNFGNGTCDNKATISINGKVYDFEMR